VLVSFKAQYVKLAPGSSFDDLKERLRPVCQRTLRRQVLEYISYTERIALTQSFEPSNDEHCLYDLVTEYLRRPSLYALPSGQRQLMTLILRRLLTSSTFAIWGTLDGLAQRLQGAANEVTAVDAPPPDLADNFEAVEEIIDEWDEEGDDNDVADEERKKPGLTEGDLPAVRAEIAQLREFAKLAQSIVRNSKGERLEVWSGSHVSRRPPGCL
jgi:hypothetical protein